MFVWQYTSTPFHRRKLYSLTFKEPRFLVYLQLFAGLEITEELKQEYARWPWGAFWSLSGAYKMA